MSKPVPGRSTSSPAPPSISSLPSPPVSASLPSPPDSRASTARPFDSVAMSSRSPSVSARPGMPGSPGVAGQRAVPTSIRSQGAFASMNCLWPRRKTKLPASRVTVTVVASSATPSKTVTGTGCPAAYFEHATSPPQESTSATETVEVGGGGGGGGMTATAAIRTGASIAAVPPSGGGCRGLGRELRRGLVERERAAVALPVAAQRDRALLRLAVANHEHVRHLAQLGLADLAPDRLRAGIDLDSQAGLPQRGGGLTGVAGVAVGDRQHDRLDRRQPERELSRVVLDQDPDEALERAHQRPVDHHRPVLGVVGAGVGELEALRHRVVELDRAELPRAADRVGHVQVDLRAVERSVAGVDLELEALRAQRALERRLGAVPHLVGADPVVGPGGELQPRLEAERAVEEEA